MSTAIGIDPASGKESCIWYNSSYQFVKAQGVREKICEILSQEENCFIAWDAPLSFHKSSYSDRKIDKITRAWVKSLVAEDKFEKSSINALPFSGLSHWVISCEALGYPYGDNIDGLSLYKKRNYNTSSPSHHIAEVHPAVSMGCMWRDLEIDVPFPVYKKSKDARKLIVEKLSFPEECIESDDVLDAYVAFLMADMFLKNTAAFVNSPVEGSYILPIGNSYDILATKFG
jgi:hypothetical protein